MYVPWKVEGLRRPFSSGVMADTWRLQEARVCAVARRYISLSSQSPAPRVWYSCEVGSFQQLSDLGLQLLWCPMSTSDFCYSHSHGLVSTFPAWNAKSSLGFLL